MSAVSLGDLAQSFILQRRSVELRQEMSKLTDELSMLVPMTIVPGMVWVRPMNS